MNKMNIVVALLLAGLTQAQVYSTPPKETASSPYRAKPPVPTAPKAVTTDDGAIRVPVISSNNPGDALLNRYQNILVNRLRSIRYNHPRPIKPDECDLCLEVFPMYYQAITRTATFRVIFSSNCMEKRDINFEISYENHREINWFYHPTTIYLNLFSNIYRLEFDAPVVTDRYDIMKALRYNLVTIHNLLGDPRRVNLMFQNNVCLNPQERHSFNEYNIDKIRASNAFAKCNIRERKMRNWKQLIGKRNQLQEMLAKARYSPDESEKLIRLKMKSDVDGSMIQPRKSVSFEELRRESKGLVKGKNAFEQKEEEARMKNREKVLERLRFEFLDSIDAECAIA
jgi:hypothetical protein